MFKKIILLITASGLIFLGITFAKNSSRPNVLGIGEKKPAIPESFGRLYELVENQRMSRDQFQLGDAIYFHGVNYLGSYFSRKEAVSYWQYACEECEDVGSYRCERAYVSKACFRLGKYYYKQDLKKSEEYFRQSAELGNSESKMILKMLEIKSELDAKEEKYTYPKPREVDLNV